MRKSSKIKEFQHTAARRRLHMLGHLPNNMQKFQHTAARRRLLYQLSALTATFWVSTHSRPKAAANNLKYKYQVNKVSTHSRPKAAAMHVPVVWPPVQFQHTAARRRLHVKFLTGGTKF